MDKRWIFNETPNPELVVRIGEEINVGPVISSLLAGRGIDTFEMAKDYFRPSLDKLHDPFLMKDLGKAVDRLEVAINADQKILIYGDYDVDGTTSVALVAGFLRKYTERVGYYINDRESEGYGISLEGIEHAVANEVDLIISIDCGIKALEAISEARNQGIDFIVCDHHTTGEALPDALAVLDPKRKDCSYPYKELSGCGVGFKLMQGLTQRMGWDEASLFERLDLLAVSIAADIVPITGENRILCYHGLRVLSDAPLPGLKVLLETSGRAEASIHNIVFGLAPRINAAGRMAHAYQALELLMAPDMGSAGEMAVGVNRNNGIRRNIDTTITEQALEMIREDSINSKSTVLFRDDWHLGVLGIVASRCIEHFYRPTIVLTQSNGSATGSARSIPGFDIYQAIHSCKDLLEKFGGHTHAAGLSLPVGNLEEFRRRFDKAVQDTIDEKLLVPPVHIDSWIDFDDITDNFVKVLQQMEPFGPGNSTPVFAAKDLYLATEVRLLKEKHIKLKIGQRGSLRTFEAIGFNMPHFRDNLEAGREFRLAFCVEMNHYMGNSSIQLRIKDIQFE